LSPLFTLDLFKEENRDLSFQSLVDRSAVLDLSQIPSDEIKSALAQIIVLSAHSYYNTQSQSGMIRQFLIFDEGHRVLDSAYMASLVRECRAYGLGVIISSQYPTDFPGDISASMATKIIHGNGHDMDGVKGIAKLLGTDGREEDISKLKRFQAFVDSDHNRCTFLQTQNYPLYLVYAHLLKHGGVTREDLALVEGIDVDKLPMNYILDLLEKMGLAEERDGKIISIRQI